ncbi:transglycosylase domain-containing protein [Oceanobacillus rekensis]|uniref:transglycosylase domain-containing protein n=1 Tax=Oceanobacillus rekensis TaxID=937927 RepID=UPI000B454D09|nr:transglycosylase domain-containing protein [Oceanobacillus rekensis]
MNFKEKFQLYRNKAKTLWKTGKVQRSSRITYDVAWNIILFGLVVGFVLLIFAGGVGAGYFASLVKDEPLRSKETMTQDIYNYSETSKLYFADNVYFGDIRSDLYREETSLDNISPTLLQAVIATEDQYFSDHHGVVPKAILRAVVQEVTNSSTQTGGSTLTQQLIKNQILTNEVSFERKAKEILLAMRLEQFLEKDDILEAYLNIIPYGRNSSGRNIAGVQTAAQGIFGINADEVNLAQAAYLAGLPQSPSAYTPFVNTGGLKDEAGIQAGLNRMQTVLNRMHDMEYITKEELDEALAYDIVADFKGDVPSPNEKYPYLTAEIEKEARKIIKDILLKEDGYTKEDIKADSDLNTEYDQLAERAMRMNGYKIHSTIDKEIYDAFQEVAQNYEHYGRDRTFTEINNETGESVEVTEKVQPGGMLIENNTGRIISFVGGRGYSEDNQINYAFSERQPGSTIKPLIDYAPAMEMGLTQPATAIADVKQTFYFPGNAPYNDVGNYGGGFHGIVSARTALANSYNIPAVATYLKVYNHNPTEYLEKMGISLTDSEKSYPSLALGGMDYGITVEQNTNAFATFGNNGKFADAYMIEKIVTNDGDIIYEHETDPVDVFTPQTNYLTVDMMRDVVTNGTARYLNSRLKHGTVDWAGKTGTSSDYHDSWFIATNPNVTMGTRIGYKTNSSINDRSYPLSYSQRNLNLWAQLINVASDIRPELVAPTERFERPDGIVEKSYCAISGMLPSELCSQAGLVKTDIFNAKFVPTEVDDSLIKSGNGLMFNPEWLERTGYNKFSDLTQLYPNENWKKIRLPGDKTEEDVSPTKDEDAEKPIETNNNENKVNETSENENEETAE